MTGPPLITEIDSAIFLMGSDKPLNYPGDGDSPVREVTLSPYVISSTAVSNQSFKDFVVATGYRTTADAEGRSFVFAGWLPDWFSPDHSTSNITNPSGPSQGTSRVMRGGSYLCHRSYCFRHRNAARSSNTPHTTTGDVGLRVAYDR